MSAFDVVDAQYERIRVAYWSAQEALCEAALAWIKAKVLDLHPNAVTLVMRGEAGEEFNTTWRATFVKDAAGGIIADLTDRDDTDPDDGPTDWAQITDMLPELNGPDGYFGETEIDLLS